MLALLVLAAVAGAAAGAEADSPCTYLFDTAARWPGFVPVHALAARAGWTQLEEDDLAHRFHGEAVLANDKLTVVLRAQGCGAEVYSRTEAGLRPRVVLAPVGVGGRRASRLASLRILENHPGAVMVEATFAAGADRLTLAYRLTTGQGTVEVRPGQNTARLLVWGKTRYVVVPEFFGDDMVFTADSFAGPWLGLPTENFLLGLADQGSAMLMCVWPSRRQAAHLIASAAGPARALAGLEIDCVKEKSLWVALLEGKGIWHEQTLAAGADAETALDWKPPFPARWRADFLLPGGLAGSWDFGGERAEGAGQTGRDCPCRFHAGSALVRAPAGTPARPLPVLVYPMDRDQATPLTTFCPMDVLRNTLGVGPCQYVLQTEGLDEAHPTPDSAMTWIEVQLKRNPQAADPIRERLDQMTAHVRQAEARIARYAAFAGRAEALLENWRVRGASESADVLRPTLQRLAEVLASAPGSASERSARLASDVVALVGTPDALPRLRRLGDDARTLGAEQDRTLARSRMAVRWLKQQARAVADRQPHLADLARELENEADRVLLSGP